MGSTLNRMVAYLIDMAIITIVLTILTAWMPISNTYKEASEERDRQTDLLKSEEISLGQYYENNMKYSFIMEKETVVLTILSIVVSLGYFGTFAYYNNGQTLGKKLVKIKIVDKEKKEVSHLKMLFRSLIINGLIVNIISTLIVLFTTEKEYQYAIILSFIHSVFLIVSFFMVAFRKDKMGLHDLIVGTNVISLR